MGLEPTLPWENPLATEISLWNFSCHPWEPSQPSYISSILSTSLVVVKRFLLSVLGYKASLQLVFIWSFRMISLQFTCNSEWSWEVVSIAFTFSSTILDLTTCRHNTYLLQFIDHIPHVVFYIPMIIFMTVICTSKPFPFFHPASQPPPTCRPSVCFLYLRVKNTKSVENGDQS